MLMPKLVKLGLGFGIISDSFFQKKMVAWTKTISINYFYKESPLGRMAYHSQLYYAAGNRHSYVTGKGYAAGNLYMNKLCWFGWWILSAAFPALEGRCVE